MPFSRQHQKKTVWLGPFAWLSMLVGCIYSRCLCIASRMRLTASSGWDKMINGTSKTEYLGPVKKSGHAQTNPRPLIGGFIDLDAINWVRNPEANWALDGLARFPLSKSNRRNVYSFMGSCMPSNILAIANILKATPGLLPIVFCRFIFSFWNLSACIK